MTGPLPRPVPGTCRGCSCPRGVPDPTEVTLVFPARYERLFCRGDWSSGESFPSPSAPLAPRCLRRCFPRWQAQRETPGEPSLYAINTVQVNGQEKYLIVSQGAGTALVGPPRVAGKLQHHRSAPGLRAGGASPISVWRRRATCPFPSCSSCTRSVLTQSSRSRRTPPATSPA